MTQYGAKTGLGGHQHSVPEPEQGQDRALDFERASEDVEHGIRAVRDATNRKDEDRLWDSLNELRTATEVFGQTVERYLGEVRPERTRGEAPRDGMAR